MKTRSPERKVADMTILPVFESVNGVRYCRGTALQITPTVALTCEHVIGGAWELTIGAAIPGRGARRLEVTAQAESKDYDEASDLALLHVEAAPGFVPATFSRQWMLDDVYAYGFRSVSNTQYEQPERDGPLRLPPRAAWDAKVRDIPFHFGLPEGFSGGPVIGTFGRERYCVGLSRLGGTGFAVSVVIAAETCVDFVNRHLPGVVSLLDLAPRALLNLLDIETRRLQEAWAGGTIGRSVTLSHRGFDDTRVPLLELEQVNIRARVRLRNGVTPQRLAMPISAAELGEHLQKVADPDAGPVSAICRFFEDRQPSLRMTDTLERCLEAGAVTFVVTGYEIQHRPHRSDAVTAFLVAMQRHQAAQWAARRRGDCD
jgi:hypothetical protein